jgi:hypothetical protein
MALGRHFGACMLFSVPLEDRSLLDSGSLIIIMACMLLGGLLAAGHLAFRVVCSNQLVLVSDWRSFGWCLRQPDRAHFAGHEEKWALVTVGRLITVALFD